MREETKTVYYADDGKVFESKTACEVYEADLLKRAQQTSYWVVYYNSDLTEGRGYCSLVYIEAYIPAPYPFPQEWVEDWCYRTFGRKLAFVQGVSPMSAWTLSRIDRTTYLRCPDSSLGSTIVKAQSVKLIVGSGESGLLETTTND